MSIIGSIVSGVCDGLGLPHEVTDIAEIGIGYMIDDPTLMAEGGKGLLKDLAGGDDAAKTKGKTDKGSVDDDHGSTDGIVSALLKKANQKADEKHADAEHDAATQSVVRDDDGNITEYVA